MPAATLPEGWEVTPPIDAAPARVSKDGEVFAIYEEGELRNIAGPLPRECLTQLLHVTAEEHRRGKYKRYYHKHKETEKARARKYREDFPEKEKARKLRYQLSLVAAEEKAAAEIQALKRQRG